VTHLRQAMLEELQRRNYAKITIRYQHPGRRAIRQVFSHAPRPTQHLRSPACVATHVE
jgi:hypothetical protein